MKNIEISEKIRLTRPTVYLENEYLYMITEWKNYEKELIPWSLTLNDMDFKLMVEKLNGYRDGIDLPDGFVENSTFWLVDEHNKILGAIDIRHKLNDFLRFRGGHIGYGIRPSERKKGYASSMLHLALKECRELGLFKVLITCSKNNIGSAKTIINNGGILDSEDIDNGDVFQRYWINLNKEEK